MAHNIACTYSISRKIGKPRKDRSLKGGNTTTGISAGISTGTSTNAASENTSLSASSSNSNNGRGSGNGGNGHGNGNGKNDHEIFNLDFGYLDDMLSTSLNSNFLPSLDFGDSMVPDNYDNVTASVNHFETYDSFDMSGCDLHSQHLSDVSGVRDGSSPICRKDHECHRQAQELLGTSLFTNPNSNFDSKTQQGGAVAASPSLHVEFASAPAFDSTPYLDGGNGSGNGVSLDQVLLLNRKAIERLASLLACPCAASPYLMMLYASLISSILTRCQHAAGSSSTWSPLVSPGESVAMARISIGAFRVDDPRVQSALNIQLLAGELRTVADLIDKIALYECKNEVIVEQSGGTNVPRLYQSLALWLRDEHSRVMDIIRSRLRELNA